VPSGACRTLLPHIARQLGDDVAACSRDAGRARPSQWPSRRLRSTASGTWPRGTFLHGAGRHSTTDAKALVQLIELHTALGAGEPYDDRPLRPSPAHDR
jgi:hypothetical protein